MEVTVKFIRTTVFFISLLHISGAVRVQDRVIRSGLYADEGSCQTVWLETQLWWYRPHVERGLYYPQVLWSVTNLYIYIIIK